MARAIFTDNKIPLGTVHSKIFFVHYFLIQPEI